MLKVFKYDCCGNVILLVDCIFLNKSEIETIIMLFGCDQCIVYDLSSYVGIRIYNRDMSEAMQCINGCLCLMDHLYYKNNMQSGFMDIVTAKNEVTMDLNLKQLQISTDLFKYARHRDHSTVYVGNYHVLQVVFEDPYLLVDEFVQNYLDVHKKYQETHNISLVYFDGEDDAIIRTFERGSGETAACASAVLACFYVYQKKTIKTKYEKYTVLGFFKKIIMQAESLLLYETSFSLEKLKNITFMTKNRKH